MIVAWAGMAAGGDTGSVLFDASRSYTLSFLLAGIAGILNLAVIGAFATTKNVSLIAEIPEGSQDSAWRDHQRGVELA